MSSEPVDLPGAIVDQVSATGGESAQVDGYLVAGAQLTEILAHAGLVGDDEGVLLIRLALAPIRGRRLVHGQASDIDHRLVVAE